MTLTTDMSLTSILALLKAKEPALRQEGVNGMFVFGSRVRGDHRPDSDLDVLVETDPQAYFGWKNMTGVMAICEDATGIPTHVAIRNDLKSRVAERIADDLTKVF